MSRGKTVIVGGGAIGLSIAYHLAKAGASDVVLLERNRIGSGTSWHAAGIVGPLRASQNLTELACYGIDLFNRLEVETDQSTGYCQTGGCWLAQSDERLHELTRIAALGRLNGLGAQIISACEAGERIPLLSTHGLSGALWVEQDGQINPVDLCAAYARGARSLGAVIREHSGVASLVRSADAITAAVLESGEVIESDTVINCAGLWAREVGMMADADVPLCAVEHMYIVSEPVPNFPNPFAIVRDLDSGIYMKGDAGKLVLGTFESNARVWDSASAAPGADFIELPEDWAHAEPMLNAGIRRIPILAELGVSRFMNGPESFTPDTRQLMGRMPGFKNFYVASGFNSIGIMSSAGVGKAMAEWVIQARPEKELWSADVMRFMPGDNDEQFLHARIPESVHNQFDIHYPFKQFRTGRNRRRSPWHDSMARHGAVFGAPGGWERPLWFARDDGEAEFRHSYGPQCWWPAARREAGQLAGSGALFELSPFSKFIVEGRGATDALQALCTNRIDVTTGRVVYSLWLNDQGGIEGDCTLNRLENDRWLVVTGVETRIKDLFHLREHTPDSVTVTDITEQYAVLGIMGPNSSQLLETLFRIKANQAAFPFSTSQLIRIAGVEVRATRISYVGERGWELFMPAEHAAGILNAIVEQATRFDIGFAGHFCLDSCRLEKGLAHWGHDIGPDDDPVGARMMHAVRLSGNFDFLGKSALLSKISKQPENERRLFEVLAPKPVLMLHDEPIWLGEKCVGRTTSGGIGFRTGKLLCMGYVSASGSERRQWHVEVAGEMIPMRILERAPYDPHGTRMRL